MTLNNKQQLSKLKKKTLYDAKMKSTEITR